MSMPGDDGFDETRGWDRASIAHRSRKPYVPDVMAADLLLPNEAGRLRTLLICSGCESSPASARRGRELRPPPQLVVRQRLSC
jgi:hypothetical protein